MRCVSTSSYTFLLSMKLTGTVSTIQNKDLSAERDAVQSKFDDLQEQVEHSLLDKEIAESELEDVQAKLKELEEKLSEVQVELEVVKEENGRSHSTHVAVGHSTHAYMVQPASKVSAMPRLPACGRETTKPTHPPRRPWRSGKSRSRMPASRKRYSGELANCESSYAMLIRRETKTGCET